jgi:hypothetical protein
MPLLEAATRLARLRRDSAQRPDEIDRLRAAYEKFTEGFGKRSLVEARAVLEDA